MKCNKIWKDDYKNCGIEINHHSIDPEYNVHGTWCYYIIVDSRFYTKETWNKIKLNVVYSQDFKYRDTDYYDWSKYDFHGGPTYGKIINCYYNKEEYELNKVGCDYAHYYDTDYRSMYNEEYLKIDAMNTIDQFLICNPIEKLICSYSGIFDDPSLFYKSKNGNIHVSLKEQLLLEHTNWHEITEE